MVASRDGFPVLELVAYRFAGLPNELGQYDELPARTGHLVEEWAKEGLINVIGGCCGTTPAHIAAISRRLAKLKPHKRAKAAPWLRLSATLPMTLFSSTSDISRGDLRAICQCRVA